MIGLCDLHCHLLYGLDDGAKTLADSLQMARILVDLGFSTIAPSPHNRLRCIFWAVVIARLTEVQSELRAAGIPLSLVPNAENYLLDAQLVPSLGTEDARLLGKGSYLLVEAPYSVPVAVLPEIIFRIKLKGVTPLIAHPERCCEFERKGRAAEAVRAGAYLQLDLGALIGRYGPKAKKLARALLEEKLYAVAATDLHSPRGGADWLRRALEELRKVAGEQAFTNLMKDNPCKMLAGQPVA